jgi:hypothetical protein
MDIHEAWVKGKSISEISRVTGRDRKTIRRLLQGGAPTERKPRLVTSKLDRFREYQLARRLGEDPVTNAEVLFDEIREQSYDGGRSILKEFMAPLREVAKNKTTERFEARPGQQGQVDWGTFKKPGRKWVQGFVRRWVGRERCTSTSLTPKRWLFSSPVMSVPSITTAASQKKSSTTAPRWYGFATTTAVNRSFIPACSTSPATMATDPDCAVPTDRKPKARPRTESATCARTSGHGYAVRVLEVLVHGADGEPAPSSGARGSESTEVDNRRTEPSV